LRDVAAVTATMPSASDGARSEVTPAAAEAAVTEAAVDAPAPAPAAPAPAPPADPPAPGAASSYDTQAGVDTADVAPVDNPPAGGSVETKTKHGGNGARTRDDASVDANGDGADDIGIENTTGAECPDPEQRGVVTSAACPLMEDADAVLSG
jgi:hypothetical protein